MPWRTSSRRPWTSIKAVTTSLLASPEQSPATRTELLRAADEEADHLRDLIDDSIELARLDVEQIAIQPQDTSVSELIRETIASMQTEIADRPVSVSDHDGRAIPLDRRLVRLAFRQLLDNALKYSPARTPIDIALASSEGALAVEVNGTAARAYHWRSRAAFSSDSIAAPRRNRCPERGSASALPAASCVLTRAT